MHLRIIHSFISVSFIHASPHHIRILNLSSHHHAYGNSDDTYAYGYPYYGENNYYDENKQLTDGEESSVVMVVDTILNIHSVNNLCGLRDHCYTLDAGAGSHSGTDREMVSICGTTMPFPVRATMCISGNGTVCSVTDIQRPSCLHTNAKPHKLLMLDLNSDGWDLPYIIKRGRQVRSF